ncbi:hypothetical protein BDM02DRAFT_3118707 [Thelephora ganbajun]|uniref:Uncharacterized protein n=1 Tax=Thelephora ganbajun TaxID=370292 RepID=A0ACB6Z9K2_THEGA|nr:hypothetical protein BDM02DRAFT_3118707 [Thelephora ganbajun]
MDAIEGCVVHPAIFLNILRTWARRHDEHNAYDTVYQVAAIVLTLGWIILWFSGRQRGLLPQRPHDGRPQIDQRSILNRYFLLGHWDTSDTFDSFTHGDDV